MLAFQLYLATVSCSETTIGLFTDNFPMVCFLSSVYKIITTGPVYKICVKCPLGTLSTQIDMTGALLLTLKSHFVWCCICLTLNRRDVQMQLGVAYFLP